MKKFNFSGVKLPILALAIFALFSSCGKENPGSYTGGGTGNGGGSGGGTGGTITINMPAAPTNPVLYGEAFSGDYSVVNIPTGYNLYINGVLSPSSGKTNVVILGNTRITFEVKKSNLDVLALAANQVDLPGVKELRSYMSAAQYVQIFRSSNLGSDGVWHDVANPGCASADPDFKVFPTGNICTTYDSRCGLPGDGQPLFLMPDDEASFTLANQTRKILRCTRDSLFTESLDGKNRKDFLLKH